MGRVTARVRIDRLREGSWSTREDQVAVEEPLEVRVNGTPTFTTMRTPGHDVELLHGFLHGEGVLESREDVGEARYCAGSVLDSESGVPQNTYNVMDVALRVAAPEPKPFVTTSSCGVCGQASIEDLQVAQRYDVGADTTGFDAGLVVGLPDLLSEGQKAFHTTGGIHAAGLFTTTGELLVSREDVGRHNAVDKVIGWALLHDRLPLSGCALVVTSRASYEITQKAAMAGIPLLATVSAASSLAIDTAQSTGITLCGFVRDGGLNAYTHQQRLT